MNRRHKHSLSHFLGLAIGLFAIWVLLSGKFEIKFLLIGLLSSLVVSFICLPFLMIKNPKTGKSFFVFGINYLKLIPYCIWVIKEIFKSTIDVSREILKIHTDYEPRIVYFSMPFENPMANVVLANSIILTPGKYSLQGTTQGRYLTGGIFHVIFKLSLVAAMVVIIKSTTRRLSSKDTFSQVSR